MGLISFHPISQYNFGFKVTKQRFLSKFRKLRDYSIYNKYIKNNDIVVYLNFRDYDEMESAYLLINLQMCKEYTFTFFHRKSITGDQWKKIVSYWVEAINVVFSLTTKLECNSYILNNYYKCDIILTNLYYYSNLDLKMALLQLEYFIETTGISNSLTQEEKDVFQSSLTPFMNENIFYSLEYGNAYDIMLFYEDSHLEYLFIERRFKKHDCVILKSIYDNTELLYSETFLINLFHASDYITHNTATKFFKIFLRIMSTNAFSTYFDNSLIMS
jgi:hypothetical protein